MNLKKENTIIGILLLLFAGFYAYLITTLPAKRFENMLGPGFMPTIFVSILAVLSIMLIAEGVVKHKKGEEATNKMPLTGPDILRIASFFLLIILYIYGIIYLGSQLSKIIFHHSENSIWPQ